MPGAKREIDWKKRRENSRKSNRKLTRKIIMKWQHVTGALFVVPKEEENDK